MALRVTMAHKGYVARINYDVSKRKFTGSVTNAPAHITFDGTTPDELKREFANSVEIYEEACRAPRLDIVV